MQRPFAVRSCLLVLTLVLFTSPLLAQKRKTTTSKPTVPAATAPAPSSTASPATAAAPTRAVNLPVRQNPFPEKVNRRSAIPFKPFTLQDPQGRPQVDPRTGQVITRETMIRLPNGKRMTAGEYIDMLNAIEQRHNALGYSLRERKSKQRKVTIAEAAVDRSKLQAQKSKILSAAVKPAPAVLDTAGTIRTVKKAHDSATRRNLSVLTAGPFRTTQPQGPGISKTWELPMGDRSTFYVGLNGKYELGGTTTSTNFKGSAGVDAAVLNRNIEILNVDGEAISPLSEPLSATVRLRVLGNSVTALDEDQVNILEKDGDKSLSVQWSKEWPFTVGPIPMSVELGVRGKAGVRYYMGLQPVSVVAVVVPYTKTSAYGQLAAIDVQVAEAGVEGEVVLLNDDLIFTGIVQLAFDGDKPYLWQDYGVMNYMESLSGDISLYACVWVPGDGWKVWDPEQDCTYEELWDWEGYKQSDYLFSGTKKDYL